MRFESDFRKISCLILLLLNLFVLLASVEGENGSVNSTYYVSDYEVLNGTYVSGSFPASVQTVDSDFLTIQSVAFETTNSSYPSEHNLVGLTNLVSGDLSGLASDDNVYMTFRSYYSGTDTSDFVDGDMSNVDSSADKGTHSNFTAQKTGPDLICDTLTEENTGDPSNTTLIDAESFEGVWPPFGWTESGMWNRESNQAYDGIYSADFDGLDPGSSGNLDTPTMNCSGATAIYVSFYFREALNVDNELSLRFWNGSAWVNIEDLGLGYPPGWSLWEMTITSSQFFISDFQIRWATNDVESFESAYVDLVTVKKEVSTYNYELDLEAQWTNADYDEASEELAIYVYRGNNTYSLDATGGYMLVGDGTPDWGSTTGTISFWVKMDVSVQGRFWGQNGDMETRWSGTNLVLDWGASASMTSATSFSADTWYFIAIVWDENSDNLFLYVGDENNSPILDANSLSGTWTSTALPATENRFMNGLGADEPVDGQGDDLRYWNIARNLTEIQGDYNIELTGSEPNLRSYFKLNNDFDDIGPDNSNGSGSGSYSFSPDVSFNAPPTENIQVDVWNGTVWQNLFSELINGWNNISISSYLVSSILTIRFKGEVETSDNIQDSWNIDVTMLTIGFDEYTSEVEFTGSSNMEDWIKLDWTVDIAWTMGLVNVTLQLYNYTLDGYSTNGYGYMAYTSDNTSDTDENISQTINVDPTHFRNATSHWKIKIEGVKTTATPFDFKVDWIEFNSSFSVYTVSTEFFFSDMITNTPTELNLTVVGQFSVDKVSAAIQVWNYSSSAYATNGESYLEYASNGANETKTLNMNADPQSCVSDGNARMKITGLSTKLHEQEIDQIKLSYTYLSISPTASFSYQPIDPTTNESIIFNASASYDEDGTIVSYRWDFGDGNVTTVSVPALTHVYVFHGTFAVNLTVTDSDGFADSKMESVIVQQYSSLDRQSFDWIRILLYILPVLFGILFLLILILKRKKKVKPNETERRKPSVRKKTESKKARKTKSSIEKKTYPFSTKFGMKHQQVTGKKILLEIDPTGDYQKALIDFVSEVKNCDEKLFIFTGVNSPLLSKFSDIKKSKFFLLASETSSSQQINRKGTLLSASDLSVLLNTFVKIQEVKTRKTINILFDNLSDTILLCGFEKTYKFIRWLVEVTSSPKATTLFVFNPSAHDSTTCSSIRALFQTRFAYGKNGPKVGTL